MCIRDSHLKERKWLYQNPLDILIKASNGASDFGNKFGQPLICGSLFTFEHKENQCFLGYDKVIMLAGGIGYANADHAIKKKPKKEPSFSCQTGRGQMKLPNRSRKRHRQEKVS